MTKEVTVDRYSVAADGSRTQITQPHKVTVTVDRTSELRSLQLIHVSWTGAHPTGGIVGDQNSDLAQNEEYPMVLLQCRGIDSQGAPLGQQLRPETCWTQFASERFSYGYSSYPAWRSDAVASAQQRAALVGAPATVPAECKNILLGTVTQHWLPFAGADGTSYTGGPFGCAGQAPEAAPANLSTLSLPSNETFGVTGSDGTGQADFDVFTAEDHSSLGCSRTVPCSLVAIPVEGINCDSSGALVPAAQRPSTDDLPDAQAACETTGRFKPGQSFPPGQSGQDAVDGTLWWSPSNWARRISVPLTFAAPDNACGLANSQTPLNIYGSELMIQATTQWAPHFCLDAKLFNFNHVQTPEPQAASLLNTGNIEAAFISEPPPTGFTTPTVTAPVAVTGFGIAFTVDDQNGRAVTTLKLNARLLAKLLTESYPDLPLVKSTYPALASNPLNITMDPEFQALNPGIPQKIRDAAATLLTVNTDSDVMAALTAYIDADPDARSWLDGHPDPWGMVVNPAYAKIELPVANWPLLDTFKPQFTFGQNPCFYTDPVPFLPLVAAPTARLFSIGQDVQFAIAQSQTVCVTPSPDPTSLAGAKVVATGRQQVGARFMLGVVSLGDAAREGLRLAALQTHKDPAAADKFANDTGRTFVAPTATSMLGTARLLKPDAATRSWPVPYATLRSDPAAAQAYPGTMLVYAAVPTRGLPKTDATHLAQLLAFAAGTGQQPGSAPGTLPSGYVPMTAANGLAALAAFTSRAAQAVAAQQGTLPPLVPPTATPAGGTPAAPPTTTTVLGSGTGPTSSGTVTGTASSRPAATASLTTARPLGSRHAPAANATPVAAPAAPVGYTSALTTGAAGAALPVLALLGVTAGLTVGVVRLRGRVSR